MTGDQKQDNRLAFLGALAGGLAHEIKNPLSSFGMNLQLLQEDWQKPETERERRLVRKLEVLAREVERLQSILDDFLRFAGEHKLDRRPCQVSALIEDVLEFLAPKLAEARVEVRTMLAEDLPPLSLDRGAMKQVLLNLVLNAIQAMPRGGELMVRCRPEGLEVVIELTDTGEGIPPDLMDRIWQVYYSRRKTGTGMGLPTARRFVEEHDGTIAVVSEPGQGTRFTIRLPVPRQLEG
jgi:signal transduction histidine kinase